MRFATCSRLLAPLLLPLVLGACHGPYKGQVRSEHQGQRTEASAAAAPQRERVKLPGLDYLSLGDAREQVLADLSAHGFGCNPADSTYRTRTCTRPVSLEDPTGGVVTLEFQDGALSGIQAQVQAKGGPLSQGAPLLYQEIERSWIQAYGPPIEVKRPGIVAARHLLPGGAALILVCYDHEPSLLMEHLRQPPGRSSGPRYAHRRD